MLNHLFRTLWRLVLITGIAALAVVTVPRAITTLYAFSRIESTESVPPAPYAIVYGAGLRRDGRPAAVLRDRLDRAIELYDAGVVSKLLLSGAAPEPDAMLIYALEQGVPAVDMIIDNGGLRTYDTCFRAKTAYGVESAVLVTQAFHLPRALYLCNLLGIDAYGVAAYESRYWRGAMFFWNVRETLATVVALWEVHISKPLPAFSGAVLLEEAQ